jgi:O-antigen ligase
MKVQAASAWVAALFLASVLFSHTVALRLLLLGLGIALAAFTLVRARGAASALPQVWLPFLLWALWSALSLAWSIEPDRSEKELRNEVIYSGLALWVCYVCAQAPNARRILLPIVAAGMALACLVAIYYFSPTEGKYLGGWHGGPGDHSCALLTIAPCLVALALHFRPSRLRALAWIALGALIIVSAYTTLNRTIWIGFAVEIAIIAALTLWSRWSGLAARTKTIVAIALVGGVAVTALMGAFIQAEREATRTAVPFTQDPRLALWPEVVELIKARPVTGYGFGRGLMRHEFAEDIGDAQLWHAHNLFLDAALQTGVPGLCLFLLLIGSVAWAGWRASMRGSGFAKACGIALVAVVAGMIIRNLTDSQLARQNALLFWGVAGVLLAWSRDPGPAADS